MNKPIGIKGEILGYGLAILVSICLLCFIVIIHNTTGLDIMLLIAVAAALTALDSSKIELTKYKSAISWDPIFLFILIMVFGVIVFPWYLLMRYKIKRGLAQLEADGNSVTNSQSPGKAIGYIDSNLMEGEHVIYRAKLHWMVFAWPIIWFYSNSLVAYVKGPDSAKNLFFSLAVITAISALITYKTSEFGITNKRILIKFGFIRRRSLETLLTKVEGIQIEQGIFGRMLDYGTIIITGTGGTHSPFKKISLPLGFRKAAQEQIELAQKHGS